MKIGIRKPSPKKSFKARTTGKMKRKLKKAANPFYGKKGMGMIRNPKKAVYNKVYSKTTIDSRKLFSGPKKRTNKATNARVKSTQAAKRANGVQNSTSGTWLTVVGVVGVCAFVSIPIAVVVLIAVAAYYVYKHFTGHGESNQGIEGKAADEEPAPDAMKDELSRQFWANEDIQSFQRKYYDLSEAVEAEYKRLNNGEGFSGQSGDKLVEDCRMGIEMSKCLVDIWNKYQEPIPRIPFYYRLAIVYEKRCEYDNAVQVCVDAICAGQSDDRTKGGMSARIQRLAKKGNLTLDDDTLTLLKK